MAGERADVQAGSWIETDVPPRLDALGWSSWHRRVVLALGITWILDGLEASLIANLAPTLRDPRALGLSGAQIGLANSGYLLGQVSGALVFGHLTDRLGRKRLFLVTLTLYLLATALSGLAPSFGVFLVFRYLAGAGIGGEYAAINSAIDELVPARIRGRVNLAINGSYWVGVAAGALFTLLLLDPRWMPVSLGWRLVFGFGASLGVAIVLVRQHVPESPRWLLMHGRVRAAERVIDEIEAEVYGVEAEIQGTRAERRGVEIHGVGASVDGAGAERRGIEAASRARPRPVRVRIVGVVGARHLLETLLRRFPRRTALGVALMVAQVFLYNSIFFSYGLILERFHGVQASDVGLYVVPFAIGNFLGPLLLGPLFDRWGRRIMIPATYALSGGSLLVVGALFLAGRLDAASQTGGWSVVFFFASAAASSAYLTVSELFPVEIRGMTIALFYALATLVGAAAPTLFGRIVDSGEPLQLFYGYALAAALMLFAALLARLLGVAAERRSLEEINAEE